jgi:5-methylcytosine-specific restriction endonuclease McrA
VTFRAFAALCSQHGLQSRDCGDLHWQVLGGKFPVVNYYPSRGTVYVSGLTFREGRQRKPIEAIEIAVGAPEAELTEKNKRDPRKKKYRKEKRILGWSTRVCHWCGDPMESGKRTLDHVIPLSRGGRDVIENMVLACKQCNTERGNSTAPPPTAAKRRAERMATYRADKIIARPELQRWMDDGGR